MRLATSGTSDYLFVYARELLFRVFFERNNTPLEFSALRVALEAHGIKAESPNHWGIFASALKNEALIEPVGREHAVVASRNQAKNSVYRLSKLGWNYAKMLAERRNWTARGTSGSSQDIRQESLL